MLVAVKALPDVLDICNLHSADEICSVVIIMYGLFVLPTIMLQAVG